MRIGRTSFILDKRRETTFFLALATETFVEILLIIRRSFSISINVYIDTSAFDLQHFFKLFDRYTAEKKEKHIFT
jgi:hypothetical protein